MMISASQLRHVKQLAEFSNPIQEQIFEAARYACFRTEGKNSEWLWSNLRIILTSIVVLIVAIMMTIYFGSGEMLFLNMPIALCVVMYFALKAKRKKYMDMIRPFIADAVAAHKEQHSHVVDGEGVS